MSLLEFVAWGVVFLMGVWAGSKYESSRVHQCADKQLPYTAGGNVYSIAKLNK